VRPGTPVNVTVAHPEDGEEPGKLLVRHLEDAQWDLFGVSALVADAVAVQELPGQQERLAPGGIALGDANPVTTS